MDRGTEGEERFFVSREINEWTNLSDKVIFLIFTNLLLYEWRIISKQRKILEKEQKGDPLNRFKKQRFVSANFKLN